MKTKTKILIAFILNLIFSIFEFIGGIITGSIAITSDAVHDFGDALSICISYFLEKISNKKPNKNYSYGYLRFSVLGGVITNLILLISSGIVIYNAILRFINPTIIDYNGMIVFAIVGLVVNLIATYFTHGGRSINQKAVNLHMLEDVLGWLVVLIGAVIIKFTDFYIIDPILSILVSIFIIINVVKNLKEITDIFLIKTPKSIDIDELIEHIGKVEGVKGVHHVHFWTIDGQMNCATMHVVCDEISINIKEKIKEELNEHGISHVTIEMEKEDEICTELTCEMKREECCHHQHYHHQHHHK